MFFDIVKVFIL